MARAHCWTCSLCDDRRATEPRVPGKDELGLAHIVMAAWPGVRDRGNRYQETATAGTSQLRPGSLQCVELVTAAGPDTRHPAIIGVSTSLLRPVMTT